MIDRRVMLAAGLGLAVLAGACHQDELFTPPAPPYAGGAMFRRYVSLGNSITAGFQSGGINDTTQLQSYARLVANAMGGDPWYYPNLTYPGCPPPYSNVFTGVRITGDTVSTRCFFRSNPIPPYINNVAVPGAEVIDVLKNGPAPGTNSTALTQLMLGGRTQVEAMMDARPTFVSVWIGNNDILGAALASDTTVLTDTTTFKAQYSEVLDSIARTGAKGLLIAVGEGTLPQTVLPFFSRGSVYYALFTAGAFAPAPFTVDSAGCASPRGDVVLVPFPFGLGLINAAQGGTPTTLTCTEPQTLEPQETVKIAATQAAYNAFIQAEAGRRNWAYLQLNPTFDSLGGVANQIAAFPNTAVACSSSPFGLAFSCDGIHPSTATHRLIAQKVVQAINSKYGSAIPAVP